MSIYVVNLLDWFPPGDEKYSICYDIVKSSRCEACGSRVRYKRVLGYHSLPWGHLTEVWCSDKCYHSGKTSKPDKRRLRRLRRYQKDYIELKCQK